MRLTRDRFAAFSMVFWLMLALLGDCQAAGQDCGTPEPMRQEIQGTVEDPQGAVVVGAYVALRGKATPHHTEVTDKSGRFHFSCLPLGHYVLSVTANTFRPQELPISLTQKKPYQTLQIKLLMPIVDVLVDVQNGSNPLDSDHGAGTKILSERDLEGLADDPDDLLRELQAIAATAGGSPGDSIVTVDGFQNGSKLPPKSAIREVRINPDLFSAEYEKPPYEGGRIEVLTKSGQDHFHGALFGNYNNYAFNARDSLAASRANSTRLWGGFELTGPLFSHNSSFAATLERRQIDEYATVNATILDNTFRITPFRENIPTPQTLWSGHVKAEWQVSPRHLLVASYASNVDIRSNQGVGGITLPEAGFDRTSSQNDLRIMDAFSISPKVEHESRLGLTWKHIQQTPLSSDPSLEIAGAFNGGGARNQRLQNHELDIEADDNILINRNKHIIKAGLQCRGIILNQFDSESFNGSFLFGGSLAPGLDANGQPIPGSTGIISGLEQYRRTLLGLAGGVPTTFTVRQGNPILGFSQSHVAIYAQDLWRARSSLSISMGLRYAAQTQPTSLGTWAPRLGIAWSPDKKHKWMFRARTGMFYSSIDQGPKLNQLRNDGAGRSVIVVDSPSFPQLPSSTSGTNSLQDIVQFSPDVVPAKSLQIQFGLEHDFPRHWHLEADTYLSRGWDILRSRNINAPLDPSSPNPIRPFAPGQNIFEFESTGRISGPVTFLGLNQSSYKRFRLFMGYLYFNMHTDADNALTFPQSSYTNQGEWARPLWQSSHRFFMVGTINLPWHVTFAPFADIASGTPYNITTGFDNNGDGVVNDRPALVSAPGPGVIPTDFGFLTANTVNGNLPRNAGTLPTKIRLDASLSRRFLLRHEKQSITLNIRSTNLLNHTNVRAVDGILGSPLFALPVASEAGRHVDLGLRYNF